MQGAFAGWLVALAVCLSVTGCGYSQPEESFLKSSWHMVHLNTPAMGTVAEFVEAAKAAQMSDGKRFEVLGWKKDGNAYSLHIRAKQEFEMRFTHVLSPPSNGAESTLDAFVAEGNVLNPAPVALDILAAAQAAAAATK